MSINVDFSSVDVFNKAARLLAKCESCGHSELIQCSPKFDVDDNKKPIETHVLKDHNCNKCQKSL